MTEMVSVEKLALESASSERDFFSASLVARWTAGLRKTRCRSPEKRRAAAASAAIEAARHQIVDQIDATTDVLSLVRRLRCLVRVEPTERLEPVGDAQLWTR